ncbi:MAG: hypothetical protein ACRECR_02130 [Thermoplasmata archaeon]
MRERIQNVPLEVFPMRVPLRARLYLWAEIALVGYAVLAIVALTYLASPQVELWIMVLCSSGGPSCSLSQVTESLLTSLGLGAVAVTMVFLVARRTHRAWVQAEHRRVLADEPSSVQQEGADDVTLGGPQPPRAAI